MDVYLISWYGFDITKHYNRSRSITIEFVETREENLMKNNKNIVLFVTIAASFLMPYMGSSMNIALPTIGEELNMSAVALSWVATSYLLSTVIVLLPLGRLSDMLGRKKIFLYGIILYTMASLFCAFSFSSVQLIIFRVLQGIGSAMIYSTAVAILTSLFPKEERGKIMGIYVAAVYIGLSMGPFLGGVFTQYLGWRSVFYLNVPVGIIIATLIIWKVKEEWVEAKGEKFDFVGSVIYGVSLFLLIYGLSRLPEPLGILFVSVGAVGLIAFGLFESRSPSPILQMDLFKNNRVFIFSSLAALINYSATFSVSFLLGLYLQYIKGFTPQMAGAILIAQPAVQALLSPFAGKLSDRIEPLKLSSLGMVVTAVALVFFIFLGEATSLLYIIGTLMILGVGLALFSSPNTNAIMSSVDKKYYGIASGMLATMRVMGQNMSLGITMVVFALVIGNVQITSEYYPQFLMSSRAIFFILSVLCGFGVFFSMARGKMRK